MPEGRFSWETDVKFSELADPRPPSLSFSLCFHAPLGGPLSPPLVLWPLTSTPSVLLSTHCAPLKEPWWGGVEAAAVKVKMHLILACVCSRLPLCWVGSSNQVQLQDKPNPPSLSPLSLYPQGPPHPSGRVSSLFHCTPSLPEDLLPVYSLSIPLLLYPSFCSFAITLALGSFS